MAGISDTIKALLNRGLSIFHKTKLGDILAAQLPPYTFPSGSADGFVKYTTPGTGMETQTYATAANIADVTKDTESAGTSKTVARGDHKHDISTAAASTLTPATTNTEGNATSLARSNHTHACTCASATQNGWNASNAEGTAASFARSDHKHADKGTVKRYTHTFTHADFTAAAQAEFVALPTFPTNAVILGGFIDLKTDFSGGGTASADAELGDAGDPNELADSVNVFTGAGAGLKPGVPTALTGLGFQPAYAPGVTMTVDVAKTVADLDAGEMIVQVFYIQGEAA